MFGLDPSAFGGYFYAFRSDIFRLGFYKVVVLSDTDTADFTGSHLYC